MEAKELIGLFGYLMEGLEAIERRHDGLSFYVELGSGLADSCLLVRMSKREAQGYRTGGHSIPYWDLSESKFPGRVVQEALCAIERDLVGAHPVP